MLLSEATLTETDTRFLAALCADPAIGRAVDQTRAFVAMVHEKDMARSEPWLARVHGRPLGDFAEGLRRDRAAVEAALRLPWSTGPVEGGSPSSSR
jgi:transposase